MEHNHNATIFGHLAHTHPKFAIILAWFALIGPTIARVIMNGPVPFIGILQVLGIIVGIWASIEVIITNRKRRRNMDVYKPELEEINKALHKEYKKRKK